MPKWAKICVMGAITMLLGVLAIVMPVGLNLEEAIGLPVLFHLRGIRPAPEDVVIVTVDESSRTGLGSLVDDQQQYRSLHGRITDCLREAGAAVIAFDLVFEKAFQPEHDQSFADAIARAGNVVLCEALKTESLPLSGAPGTRSGEVLIERQVRPLPLFARVAAATAPFPLPKVPVRVSQYWTFKTIGGDKPTLPIVAFQIYALQVYDAFLGLVHKVAPDLADALPMSRDAILVGRGAEKWMAFLRHRFTAQPQLARQMLDELQHGDGRSLPDGIKRLLTSLIHMYQSENSLYLNFYGPPGSFTTLPHYRLLLHQAREGATGELPNLRGKAVFVGLSELSRPEQRDGFFTIYSQPNGIDLSGVEIGATAFGNLLEDGPIRLLGTVPSLIILSLWGILLALVCRLFPTVVAGLTVLILGAGYVLVARYQFSQGAFWYPLVTPLALQAPLAFLGTIGWKYYDSHRERQHIRKVFGYYLPDDVVDQLARDRAAIHNNTRMVYGVCLYTDAAQYTGLAEALTPGELSRFMNRYYETVFRPVRDHGGIVSDVVGDSMLALWVAAEPDRALRQRACLAALDIARALHGFGAAAEGRPFRTRIGLHYGHMSLGNIGGIDRYEYRAVGDVVNTTSRIEGLSKYLGTQILASEEAIQQLEGLVTRNMGTFVLAGKSKPVAIHELMGRADEVPEIQRNMCALFSGALAAYRQRSWDEALRLLHECLQVAGDDGPSQYYLKLCEQYREQPPEDPWDGVIVLNRK
jgi:adenylate cyclase